MRTVKVSASKTYDIKIGPGLLSSLGDEVKALGKARKVAIGSETNVYPIYGKTALEGHFGVEDRPWEETDIAAELKRLAGI